MTMAEPVITEGKGQNRPFGSIERQIARRYLGAKKSEGGVAIIAVISFICVTLAIASMITILSIMNGFREQLIDLTIGSEGHVYVGLFTEDAGAERMADLERRLQALPEVESVFEFSENGVGFNANEQISVGRVIGISNDDIQKFELVSNNIQYGSLNGFGQGRGSDHQIAMGSFLASGLGLQVGDRVRIFTSRTRSTVTGPVPISKIYTIGAIFQVGYYPADSSTVYMELDQSQLLFSDGKKGGDIQIRLTDADLVDRVIPKIEEIIGEPAYMRTWKDRNESTVIALKTEQVAMTIIFSIVVLISCFPILAAMIMLVKNKSKDIAILRTIGATRGAVLRIFFIAGTTIGLIGTIAGLAIGLAVVLNIDVVQFAVETITGQPLFPPDVYQISTGIPAKIVWSEVLFVALLGFAISAVATFFPAWGASKTDPVEALRYD